VTVTCPACKQIVEPAPLERGAYGWRGAARFCPTRTGPLSRCETDLASVLLPDGTRLLQPPTEEREHELESSLLSRVCRWLNSQAPHVAWWRQSVGRAFRADGTALWYGTPGMADLLVLARGTFVAVELKSEKGRQQANQRKYEKQVQAAGGIYVLARDLETVKSAVEGALSRRVG
jgi:hypothetical protein